MWCWTRPINIRHDSNHDLTFSTFFILSSNSEFFLILSTLNFPKSQFLFCRGGSKKTTIPLYQQQQNTFAFFVSFNTRNWWRRELIRFTSIIRTSSRRWWFWFFSSFDFVYFFFTSLNFFFSYSIIQTFAQVVLQKLLVSPPKRKWVRFQLETQNLHTQITPSESATKRFHVAGSYPSLPRRRF